MEKSEGKAIISEMKNEAKILKYLHDKGYPNAPRLYFSGYWGHPYFYLNIMELLEGKVT